MPLDKSGSQESVSRNISELVHSGRPQRVHSVIADVRDAGRLAAAVAGARPEIVFHLAAQPIVRESYRNPLERYATNVLGTADLLEAVRSCGDVRAVVNVTSDKCYENREWVWGYRENEPLGGYDPCSSSKACSELVTAAYRRSFFGAEGGGPRKASITSARAGHVIGGGGFAADRPLPDCVRAIRKGEKILLRNPGDTRPWQRVLEPLDGYLLLARRLFDGGEPHLLLGHTGNVDAVAVSPDLRWVASSADDGTLRLWPMPDLGKPPLHTLPHDELVAKLKSLTNLRAVRDEKSATGWTIELGPFPGWKNVPSW